MKKLILVFVLVALFALGACTTTNSNSELLSETVSSLMSMSGEVLEYAEEKAALLNQEEISEEDMEQLTTVSFELETRRIRIDSQIAALKDGNVVDGRDMVSVEKDLEDHQDLVDAVVESWNNIADDYLAISDTAEYGEHVEDAMQVITSSENQFGNNLIELEDAITNN